VADEVICFIVQVNKVLDEGFWVDLEISWILIIYLVLITADNSKSNVHISFNIKLAVYK
jgi:hypothetical protein